MLAITRRPGLALRIATGLFVLAIAMLTSRGSQAADEEHRRPMDRPASTAQSLFEALPGQRVDSLCERGWVEVELGHPDGAEFDGMEALVLFDLPKDRVLELLAQTDRQPEYRDDLRDLRRIAHSRHFSLDEHRSRVMLVPFEYRVRYRFDYARSRMSWQLEPGYGGSLETLEGFWALHEFGEGRTLAHFGASVRVSDALPGFIQDSAVRKRIPRDLESTRAWVNARGLERQ